MGLLESKTNQVMDSIAGHGLADLPELINVNYKNFVGSADFPTKADLVRYTGEAYLRYLHLVRDLARLSDEDKVLITQARALCKEDKVSRPSASNGGADYLLEALGTDRRKVLLDAIISSAKVDSEVFNTAVADLTTRVTQGHQLNVEGTKVGDKSPDSRVHHAIWGPTLKPQPKAMVDQLILHLMTRTFSAYFASDPEPKMKEMLAPKDSLITALGDVVYLQTAQGTIDPLIGDMWLKTRKNGGIEYNEQAKQDRFNTVVNKS